MEYLLIIGAVLAVLAVVVVLGARHARRNRQAARDDLQRTGSDPFDPTSLKAYNKAQGEAAWTRISGGA